MSEAVPGINEKLKALIEPLEHLTTSIKEYTGSQSADASVTVSPVDATAQAAVGSAVQEASGSAAPDAAVQAVPGANQEEKAAQVAAGQGDQVEERPNAAQGDQEAAGQGDQVAAGSAQVAAGSAQEAAGSAQAAAGSAVQETSGSAAPEASGSAAPDATAQEASGSAAQGAQEAQEASGSAAQEAQAEAEKAASGSAGPGANTAENVPAFKQSNSNIKFNNSDGRMGTNYFQIMNRKIDKFFKQIDNEIANADPEDQNMLRERKVKYERVKQLLQDATTEAEVNKIIKDNQVVFDSNSIRSGGTRKPRMHRRKKTQRKRSKTIKKKNRAGNRK